MSGGVFKKSVFKPTVFKTDAPPPPPTVSPTFYSGTFYNLTFNTDSYPPPTPTKGLLDDTHDGIKKQPKKEIIIKQKPLAKPVEFDIEKELNKAIEQTIPKYELGQEGAGENDDFISGDEMRKMMTENSEHMKEMHKKMDSMQKQIDDTLSKIRRLNQDIKDVEKLTNIDLGYKDE